MSDIKGWASAKPDVELLSQSEDEEGGEKVYRHVIRRTVA